MATDYFLKIDGIDGESKDHKHKNAIDVLAWNWGESNTGAHAYGGGGGSGKVNMQDMTVTMKVNSASPKLMLACASGKHIPKAVLTCRKAGDKQQEYLIYTLSDLMIASFQSGGSQGDEIPVETLAINFAKIEYKYYPQDAKGGLGGVMPWGWDLKENKAV